MAKASLRQLQDKYIGSLGLRVYKTLADSKSPTSESNSSKAVDELIKSIRWWGESYGFFHRKTDGVTFAAELTYLYQANVINFGESSFSSVQGDWYIDPETNAIKNEQIKSRFNRLEPLGQFPLVDFTRGINLPLQSCTAVIALNTEALNKLKAQDQVHAGRIVTIAQNILILMTSYSSEQQAKETAQSRPALTLISNSTNIELYKLGTVIGAAELAKVFEYRQANVELGSDFEEEQLKSVLGRQNSKLYDYADFLASQYGVINTLMWEAYPEYISLKKWETPAEIVIEVEEQIPQPEPKQLDEEATPTPATSTQEIEQPKLTPVKPQTQTQTQTVSKNLNSVTHQFELNQAECVVTVIYEFGGACGINISAFKVDTTTTQYLVTVSKLLTKLLEKGSSLQEVSELLEGMIFEPRNAESSSILDYVGNWLTQLEA